MSRFADELRERALRRQERSQTGIGAAWTRDLTERDRDGQRHLLVVTDGRRFRWAEVLLPRLPHSVEVAPGELEAGVERLAGRFARESRLQDLQDEGPHGLEDVPVAA
jgi:hypothetical protein